MLFTINSQQQDCTTDDDGNEKCFEIKQGTNDVINYTEHILSMPPDYNCKNDVDSRDCDWWKSQGICQDDPGFMTLNCAKSCGYCHLKDPSIRCQRHPNAKQAVHPGDINKMFERLLTDFTEYSPKVLSQPPDPWLVVLENVFSDKECDTLIDIGGRNFHRSKDAGEMSDEDDAQFIEITSEGRTSYSDWCVNECWDHPIINGIAQKAENITMIPKEVMLFFFCHIYF